MAHDFTHASIFLKKNVALCCMCDSLCLEMKQKAKEKRVTVAVHDESHKRLEAISENTGISMRKLIDMAVDKLVCDPPTVYFESEVKK